MARSSCSLRFGLGIGCTRPILLLRRFNGRVSAGTFSGFLAQSLYAAELELFYGAFGAPEGLRNFTDTFFLSEAHLHDLPLLYGKLLHQSEQLRAYFDFFRVRLGARWVVSEGIGLFARAAPPAIRDGVRSDAHQPCSKRSAAPLEAREIRQGVVKHLGGHVLGGLAVTQAPPDVRVHALEVDFIERRKAAGVLLRRLDQPALARFLYGLQRVLRSCCCHSIELAGKPKVTLQQK